MNTGAETPQINANVALCQNRQLLSNKCVLTLSHHLKFVKLVSNFWGKGSTNEKYTFVALQITYKTKQTQPKLVTFRTALLCVWPALYHWVCVGESQVADRTSWDNPFSYQMCGVSESFNPVNSCHLQDLNTLESTFFPFKKQSLNQCQYQARILMLTRIHLYYSLSISPY